MYVCLWNTLLHFFYLAFFFCARFVSKENVCLINSWTNPDIHLSFLSAHLHTVAKVQTKSRKEIAHTSAKQLIPPQSVTSACSRRVHAGRSDTKLHNRAGRSVIEAPWPAIFARSKATVLLEGKTKPKCNRPFFGTWSTSLEDFIKISL